MQNTRSPHPSQKRGVDRCECCHSLLYDLKIVYLCASCGLSSDRNVLLRGSLHCGALGLFRLYFLTRGDTFVSSFTSWKDVGARSRLWRFETEHTSRGNLTTQQPARPRSTWSTINEHGVGSGILYMQNVTTTSSDVCSVLLVGGVDGGPDDAPPTCTSNHAGNASTRNIMRLHSTAGGSMHVSNSIDHSLPFISSFTRWLEYHRNPAYLSWSTRPSATKLLFS